MSKKMTFILPRLRIVGLAQAMNNRSPRPDGSLLALVLMRTR